MRSERLGTEEENRCVVDELARPHVEFVGVSGSGGSEDLLTTVKTNLPTSRAIGKRIVIFGLTLLHFCGGAQALNLPIRGPLRRDRPLIFATALGCAPSVQVTAPPLRVVENKHNFTALLTVGEMLQQRAWTHASERTATDLHRAGLIRTP